MHFVVVSDIYCKIALKRWGECPLPLQHSPGVVLVVNVSLVLIDWRVQGFKENLHAVFCLAENAIGPGATRPDDVHTLYSGK